MKILSSAFKLLGIIALFFIGFFFSELSDFVETHTSSPITLENTCLLSSQICTQNGVDIQLQKDTLMPLEPSSIIINWPNITAENLTLSLQAVDMDMGNPIFQLNRTTNDTFTGEILLPICIQDTMLWVGTLRANNNNIITVSLKAKK